MVAKERLLRTKVGGGAGAFVADKGRWWRKGICCGQGQVVAQEG